MNLLADTPRLELFRLAGISVRVDITFALVPLFLFGILQQAPLAIAAPAYAAIIAGVFLSVLLHEIGHATVGRSAKFWSEVSTATPACSKGRAAPPPMLRYFSLAR